MSQCFEFTEEYLERIISGLVQGIQGNDNFTFTPEDPQKYIDKWRLYDTVILCVAFFADTKVELELGLSLAEPDVQEDLVLLAPGELPPKED